MHPAPKPVSTAVRVDEARTAYATTWQPELNPRNGFHISAGSWSLMLHGRAFLGYVREETPKGGAQWGSANWAMLGASRQLGSGNLALSATTSLETLTLSDCGYPRLLAASGCDSDGFGDYQHPHGVFPELSARYTYALRDSVALLLYAAAAGEPALGAVAYHHRLSAAADPVAPMSHHELNPAHSSGGVVTAGFIAAALKLEVSAFNGEPSDANQVLPELGPLETQRCPRTDPDAGGFTLWHGHASVAMAVGGGDGGERWLPLLHDHASVAMAVDGGDGGNGG